MMRRAMATARSPSQGPRQHGELVAAVARHQRLALQGHADALGEADQQQIAGGVAEAVVDQLEAVQVEEQHGVVVTAAGLGGGQRPLQRLLEHQPVGQAGQRIVAGMEAQPLLGLALAGDVNQRAGKQGYRAFLAGNRLDAGAAHDDPALARAQPDFAVPHLAGRLQGAEGILARRRVGEDVGDARAADQPGRIAGKAQHGEQGGIDLQHAAIDVRLEQAGRRAFEQLAVAPLGVLQRMHVAALFGDVAHHPGGSDAALVDNRIGMHVDHHVMAVAMAHAHRVALHLGGAGLTRAAALHLRGGVLWMHQGHVFAAGQLFPPHAEDVSHGLVAEVHQAVLDQEHAVAATVHQHLVQRFGLAQRGLGGEPVADVEGGAFVIGDAAARVAHQAAVLADPGAAAVAPAHLAALIGVPAAGLHQRTQFGTPVRVDVQRGRLAGRHLQQRLDVGKAEQPCHRRIGVDEAAAGQAAIDAFHRG